MFFVVIVGRVRVPRSRCRGVAIDGVEGEHLGNVSSDSFCSSIGRDLRRRMGVLKWTDPVLRGFE